MHGSRFVPTTTENDRLVHRPRLTIALAARFERRLTTVVAAAGFGKTAALSLAVGNNELEPAGTDIWISATSRDADVEHFASGLARAIDVDNTGGAEEILGRVRDAIWTQAPHDIAVIIDDAHHLEPTTATDDGGRPTVGRSDRADAATQFLLRLLEELPTNAHLVLASRRPLSIPVARLRAHGQLAELTVDDLELDGTEVDELIAHRDRQGGAASASVDVDDLPRHPATADLALAAGQTASADFLWEEILAHIDDDRLADMQRASVVEVLDNELVEVLTDDRFTLNDLFADVPLTERSGTTLRLHALLREALGTRTPRSERRKAQDIAADFERQRGRWADAVQLFEAAGNPIGVDETIREFALAPVLFRSVEDNIVIGEMIQRRRPNSGIALAVLSSQQWMSQSTRPLAATDFTRTLDASIEALRREGDEELEAGQIHLRLQAGFLASLDVDDADIERLAEIGERSQIGRLLYAFNRSAQLAQAGDVNEAVRVLDAFDDYGVAAAAQWRNERLADLGRFEDIEWSGEVDEVNDTAMMSAYARWLRGDVDPALGYLVVSDLLPSVLRRGFDLVSVSTLGVAVAIAVAAGEEAAARRWRDQAVGYLGSGLVPSAEYFGRLAEGVLAASTGDEEGAAAALDPANTHVNFDRWPARPLLLSLPLVYLVRPDSRPMFDRCAFGHALTVATDAGRALVALREHDDPTRAAALPWNEPNLLRANVIPIHLVELAAAAEGAGVDLAGEVARETPHLVNLARGAAGNAAPSTVPTLQTYADGAALTAPFVLSATVLGELTLARDGTQIDDERWVRRAKVRELFAYLVLKRRVSRYEVVGDLWPDSRVDADAERKALGNLRSALSMLNSILEPDRSNDSDPFFVTADATTVRLHDSVVSDLDELQQAADSGQAADNAGLPLDALRHHRRVVELYRGPLADNADSSWLVFERLRIASLAVGSACRVAELHLGRGEPEVAAQWAQQARQHDPLSERAGRIFVDALAASGNRSGARIAADHLVAELAEADLVPDRATTRAFERLFGH